MKIQRTDDPDICFMEADARTTRQRMAVQDEALENARQRQVRDLSDTMHALVAILCDAIRIGVRAPPR